MTFCSRAALEAQEVTAGTAPRGAAYVFLPVAKRLWGEREMNASWAGKEEQAAIGLARRAGVVTRLYNPGRDVAASDASILVHTAPGIPAPQALADLLAAFSDRWPVEPEPRPRLAVCTHGTRDRCCAKWGFAAFNAARVLFEQDRSPFQALECSHLGGDRFAATGVLFPSGNMYAHLDRIDLEALAAAETTGQILPSHYRGGVFEPELTQVVRAGLARDGLFNDSGTPLDIARADPNALRYRVSADAKSFDVEVTQAEFRFYASCQGMADQRRAGSRRTVYAGARPVSAGA